MVGVTVGIEDGLNFLVRTFLNDFRQFCSPLQTVQSVDQNDPCFAFNENGIAQTEAKDKPHPAGDLDNGLFVELLRKIPQGLRSVIYQHTDSPFMEEYPNWGKFYP